MVTRVMLVDDHRLVREVLVELLSQEQDLTVVGAAADAPESVEMVRTVLPDVVVMDVHLPEVDGIAATRALTRLHPTLKVVMLSSSCSPTLLKDSDEAGACGYLVKGDPADELFHGIRTAARGGRPFSTQAAALWRSMYDSGARQGAPKVRSAPSARGGAPDSPGEE